MDVIMLSTKKELDIYMNPRRQQLLRALGLSGVPMTAKQLSDKLGISASAVQHHIRQLVDLGVLEVDHIKKVNGIDATYYRQTNKTVNFGVALDDAGELENRLLMLQSLVAEVMKGYFTHVRENKAKPDRQKKPGDMMAGFAYLKPEEGEKLFSMIRAFIKKHEKAEEGSIPWEYAFIAYDASTDGISGYDDQQRNPD